ncbi:MAG: hypothetical protein JWO35_18 [Candidatus Saccharibacteria bacterium]|nr:hypothetical protein [Candidatus Saccharibacteria bacterium]
MNNIDQEFIEFVVKSLVGKPEAVVVERRIDEKGVLLELTVDPEDLGRVIGKRGATAQSLRTLLRALGTKNDARYNLKIIDNGVGDHAHAHGDDSTPSAPAPRRDDDSDDSDDSAAKASPAKAKDEPAASVEDQTSDRLRQARAELADLDDLDV